MRVCRDQSRGKIIRVKVSASAYTYACVARIPLDFSSSCWILWPFCRSLLHGESSYVSTTNDKCNHAPGRRLAFQRRARARALEPSGVQHSFFPCWHQQRRHLAIRTVRSIIKFVCPGVVLLSIESRTLFGGAWLFAISVLLWLSRRCGDPPQFSGLACMAFYQNIIRLAQKFHYLLFPLLFILSLFTVPIGSCCEEKNVSLVNRSPTVPLEGGADNTTYVETCYDVAARRQGGKAARGRKTTNGRDFISISNRIERRCMRWGNALIIIAIRRLRRRRLRRRRSAT